MHTKLVETYVNAVKTFLPSNQKEDIARELAEDILMRIEAREAELDRPLTDAEQEAILKKMGHPAIVAGRYSSETRNVSFGRQLIGPMLFPLYLKVLGISVAVAVGANFIVTMILGEVAVGKLLSAGLINFAIVTSIFSLVQYQLTRNPDAWDPRDPLGGLSQAKESLDAELVGKKFQPVSRLEVSIELVIGAVALSWLWGLRGSDFTFGPLTLTEVVRQVYGWSVALAAVGLIPPLVNLFRPRWLAFRFGARIVINLATMALLAVLLRGGEWVHWSGAPGPAEAVFANINQWINLGLWIGLAIAGIEVVRDGFRLFQLWRRRPAPTLTGAALS